ncbi:MAG: hypothetical protein M3082_18380 [Candidatus Dormibacteraeota bacterium]|nr:hypothetical protein [Candidatus Dormibacteraeota bacterium]
MGTSSDQIGREIRETRSELDQNLGLLEQRAASNARRYGKVVVGVAASVALVTVGAIVYRRSRRRSTARQLHELLFESLGRLPDEARARLKEHLPISVVIRDKADDESPNNWTSIAAKIAPSVVGTAAGAVASRLKRPSPDSTPSE